MTNPLMNCFSKHTAVVLLFWPWHECTKSKKHENPSSAYLFFFFKDFLKNGNKEISRCVNITSFCFCDQAEFNFPHSPMHQQINSPASWYQNAISLRSEHLPLLFFLSSFHLLNFTRNQVSSNLLRNDVIWKPAAERNKKKTDTL